MRRRGRAMQTPALVTAQGGQPSALSKHLGAARAVVLGFHRLLVILAAASAQAVGKPVLAGGATVAFVLGALSHASDSRAANPLDTIQRVKESVVAVGTYTRVRSPAFSFAGTGFAVGDGSLVATNAHVVSGNLNAEQREVLVVAIPGRAGAAAEFRRATVVEADRDNDIALLKIDGPALPPLRAAPPGSEVREGRMLLVTGFPIGSVLGLVPATHQAMVSALTLLAIPQGDGRSLDARTVRRLSSPPESVIQLDAIAYPGNSGSPLYDPETGDVVGIVNAVFVKGGREAALTHPSGISYALPVSVLTGLLSESGK